MIDRAHLDAYIARKGPYLYHRAPAEALPLIARQGLLPWDHELREDVATDWEEGSTTSYADSRMTPRQDRVYVGDGGYVRRYDGLTLRIDLRKVDPATLDADEDHFDLVRQRVPPEFAAKLEPAPREWGSWSDYAEPDCEDCQGAGEGCLACEGSGKDLYADPRDEETLGDWADRQAHVLDTPEGVSYSLEQGSIAVRGGVPAEAVEVDPARLVPSDLESVARAFAGVPLPVEPFVVHHEGQDHTVVVSDVGDVVSPPADVLPRTYALERYVSEARGERAVAMFNAGSWRRPEVAPLDEAATLEPVPEPRPALGL